MVIDGSGDVGIGTPSDGSRLRAYGQANSKGMCQLMASSETGTPLTLAIWDDAGGNIDFSVARTGTVTHVAGTHTSSDIALKKDVTHLSGSLDKIKSMQGVSFKWKRNSELEDEAFRGHAEPYQSSHPFYQSENYGFIAQEVESEVPSLVRTDPGSGLKSVLDGNQVNALLVEAIKELSAKVEALENE